MVKPDSRNITQYYIRVNAETAPKNKAVCILHQKCLSFIAHARTETEKRRYWANRAQNIINQLEMSLMVEDALSQSMFYLYDYCYVLLEKPEEENLAYALEILTPITQTLMFLLRDA